MDNSARTARSKNSSASSVSEAATQCSVALAASTRHVLAWSRKCAGHAMQALGLGSFIIEHTIPDLRTLSGGPRRQCVVHHKTVDFAWERRSARQAGARCAEVIASAVGRRVSKIAARSAKTCVDFCQRFCPRGQNERSNRGGIVPTELGSGWAAWPIGRNAHPT
jgi:hypothetical protein